MLEFALKIKLATKRFVKNAKFLSLKRCKFVWNNYYLSMEYFQKKANTEIVMCVR